MRSNIGALILGIFVLSDCSSASFAVEKCYELAKPRKMAEGLPRYSDIMIRSLYIRPNDANDPHDTLKALDNFHVTRLEWMYCSDANFISKVRSKGIKFGNSVCSTMMNNSKDQNYIRDLNGNAVMPPWMRVWKKDNIATCSNHPATVGIWVKSIMSKFGLGLDALQVDDPDMNHSAKYWGGCFCDYCMSGFNSYLSQKYSAEQIQAMGTGPLDKFNLRQHMLAKGAPVGDATYSWSGWNTKLKNAFFAFQQVSVQKCMEKVREQVDRACGRHIPMSCNNASGHWPDHFLPVYDYGMGEFSIRDTESGYIFNSMKKTAGLGKGQVGTMPIGAAVLKLPEDEPVFRKHLANMYACGAQTLLPWDTYLDATPDGSARYFGKAEDYADLTAFIRGAAEYFDGYELVGGAGYGIVKGDIMHRSPVQVDMASKVAAVIRAKPGEADSAVVVHLVNWSDESENVTCLLDPSRFFGNKAVQITVLRPVPYNRAQHEEAQKSGDFKKLVSSEEVAQGCVNIVNIKSLQTWAILVIRQAEKESDQIWAPVVEPFGENFIKETQVNLYYPNAGEIRYTLDGSEPNENSKIYTGTVILNDSTRFKAAAFVNGKRSEVVRCNFSRLAHLPCAKVPMESLQNGIRLKAYDGVFDKMPEFDKLKPTLDTVIEDTISATLKTGNTQLACLAESYINITESGSYCYRSFSNNRIHETRIYIDNKLASHVRNGFQVYRFEPALEKGLHRLRIEHYQASASGQGFLVMAKGPGQVPGQMNKEIFFCERN